MVVATLVLFNRVFENIVKAEAIVDFTSGRINRQMMFVVGH
jgi:hypothetical protein